MGEGAELRADMVEAARRFMTTPKVRETPFAEQKQFLLGLFLAFIIVSGKGVTEAEIDEAKRTLPAVAVHESSGQPALPAYLPPPPPSSSQRALTFAQSLLVLGGLSYASYRFLRGWLLPRYFDVPDPAQVVHCFVEFASGGAATAPATDQRIAEFAEICYG